jgi:hypothetical protein
MDNKSCLRKTVHVLRQFVFCDPALQGYRFPAKYSLRLLRRYAELANEIVRNSQVVEAR